VNYARAPANAPGGKGASVVKEIQEANEMATILAVDDSASMRQMVTFTLKGAGHTVLEAEDGQAALDALKGKKVDAVVTDVNMPRMDGITLVKNLRALPDFKFTPILLLTTESGDNKKAEGKAAGATGWLVKPFNPDQLLATIKKVLG
jgi:two-component system chemotaxis response regulator CheY